MIINALYFIIVLSILIFVHEFGHFLVARLAHVKVLSFSLGFGKKLLTFRKGETEYAVSALPLGGYVKMLGESTDDVVPDEEASRSFSNKPPLVRTAIAFAGPFFNILFAVVVFFVMLLTGYPVLSTSTQIGQVIPGDPAYSAGLRQEDIITRINGREVHQWGELQKIVNGAADARPLKFEITRHGQVMDMWITPKLRDEKNVFGETVGKVRLIGVGPATEIRRESLAGATTKAFVDTYNMTELTIVGIVKLIKGSISAKNVGGPILIFQQVGERAKAGKSSFLLFVALISINLGVINLLPIPILDGGHIFFSIIEFISRRRIPTRTLEMAQKVGLGILVCIMVFATFNDVMRLFHGR
ncbi:MAG: RIP metalloprotease RseP [Syntrophorhabdales bacterium]|jgi:regulator of sigma E protease